jgi:hypothetical protein
VSIAHFSFLQHAVVEVAVPGGARDTEGGGLGNRDARQRPGGGKSDQDGEPRVSVMFFEPFFLLPVALLVICDLVRGQIGPKKVVDDGNLTDFIIRYRYQTQLHLLSKRTGEN